MFRSIEEHFGDGWGHFRLQTFRRFPTEKCLLNPNRKYETHLRRNNILTLGMQDAVRECATLLVVTHLERCRRWLVDWLLRPPPPPAPSSPPALIVTRDDIFDFSKNLTHSINDTKKFIRFGFRCAPINVISMRFCDTYCVSWNCGNESLFFSRINCSS